MEQASKAVSQADMVKAGLTAFFNITEKWKLSVSEQRILLGSPAEATFFKWKKKPESVNRLTHDLLERISYILGIHKALRILFSNREESVYSWIKAPNKAPIFNGRSALERMLGGNVSDLYAVRRYLDTQRG